MYRKAGILSLYVVVAAFILAPFLWTLLSSMMGEAELLSSPPRFLPRALNFENYGYIFTGKIPTSFAVKGLMRSRISEEARLIVPALRNTTLVALCVMLINLFLAAPAAYAFARQRFRGKGAMYQFVLMSRLLPGIAIAIPYYMIINSFGLLDTYQGLILVYSALTLPFSTWYLTLYFRQLPRACEEAALLDGCTPLVALSRIVAPIAAPGLTAAAVFAFMFVYNEFLFGLLLTQTVKTKTMPVLIAATSVNPDVSYALLAVCVVLAIIPPLVLAVFMNRYITRGLVTSISK